MSANISGDTSMKNASTFEDLDDRVNQLEFENEYIRSEFQAIINECRAQYHSMLDSVDAHMSLVNSDMRIIWANRNTKDMFGTDIIGEPCFRVCHGKKKPCRKTSDCIVKKSLYTGRG